MNEHHSLVGWVVAYCVYGSQDVQVGFLGRLVKDEGGIAHLEDAIEFASFVMRNQEGLRRTAQAKPLEMTSCLSKVRVRYLSLVPLDDLTVEEAKLYEQALVSAQKSKASIEQIEGQRRVEPARTPLVVPGA